MKKLTRLEKILIRELAVMEYDRGAYCCVPRCMCEDRGSEKCFLRIGKKILSGLKKRTP